MGMRMGVQSAFLLNYLQGPLVACGGLVIAQPKAPTVPGSPSRGFSQVVPSVQSVPEDGRTGRLGLLYTTIWSSAGRGSGVGTGVGFPHRSLEPQGNRNILCHLRYQ